MGVEGECYPLGHTQDGGGMPALVVGVVHLGVILVVLVALGALLIVVGGEPQGVGGGVASSLDMVRGLLHQMLGAEGGAWGVHLAVCLAP